MNRKMTAAAPAAAMTAVSMVLTLAVVVMWLGAVMPWYVALVVGAGLDGGWLTVLAYERRLARQGDHANGVTVVGWCFGVVATAVLVAHALTTGHTAGWLAVSWLPLGAKALWLVHGLWERTALTPRALGEIHTIRQAARDHAAVARAHLNAQATTEETRLLAVTAAGARVARVQAATAQTLSTAWAGLTAASDGDGTHQALTAIAAPAETPSWSFPAWTPIDEIRRPELVNTRVNTPVNAKAEILRLASEGIAQREIARRLDVAPSYVNKVVNGG